VSRPARVRVPIDFDGAKLATVEIDRNALLFTVRLYRRRRVYMLPLSMVAQIVAWKAAGPRAREEASPVSRVKLEMRDRYSVTGIPRPGPDGCRVCEGMGFHPASSFLWWCGCVPPQLQRVGWCWVEPCQTCKGTRKAPA